MNELTAQKRLLILESELNRRALQAHCSDIRDRVKRVQDFVHIGRTTSPLLLGAAAAGAFLIFRKRKSLTGFVGKALSGWQLLQTLKPLWTAFNEGRRAGHNATAETSPAPASPADLHE